MPLFPASSGFCKIRDEDNLTFRDLACRRTKVGLRRKPLILEADKMRCQLSPYSILHFLPTDPGTKGEPCTKSAVQKAKVFVFTGYRLALAAECKCRPTSPIAGRRELVGQEQGLTTSLGLAPPCPLS